LHDNKKPQSLINFNVYDEKNISVTLSATCVEKNDAKYYVLHSPAVLINHTNMELYFYYVKHKEFTPLAGQSDVSNIILLSDEKFLCLEDKGIKSKPFNISTVGITNMIEIKNNNKLFEFVMSSELSLVAKDLEIYTNIITLRPKLIIFNKLNTPIYICSSDNTKQKDFICAEKQFPFYFFGRGSECLVCFKPHSNSNNKDDLSKKWFWSYSLNLLNVGVLTIRCITKDNSSNKFVNFEKKIEGPITYIIISETTYSNSKILVENNSKSISLKLQEDNYNSEYINLNSKGFFAWSKSDSQRILKMNLLIGNFLESRPLVTEESSITCKITDDNVVINDEEEQLYPVSKIFKLKDRMYHSYCVKLDIFTDGIKKTIRLSDKINDQLEINALPNSLLKFYEIYFKVPNLGISLISDNKNVEKDKRYQRKELVYLNLSKLEFYFKNYGVNNIQLNEIQFKIGDIEILNEYENVTYCPIIVKKFIKNKEDNENTQFFNMICEYETNLTSNNSKIILLNYIVQNFTLNLDSDVIENFINFFRNISLQLKINYFQIYPIFMKNKELESFNKEIFIKNDYFVPYWMNNNILKDSRKIFIETLETSSVEINLSFFTHSKNKIFKKYLSLSSLVNAITNIENATIKLNSAVMYNVYGTFQDVFQQIVIQYRQDFFLQILKLFGSIELLGNPYNLLKNLGTGFQDLFKKPYKGLRKGPLQAFKGALSGGFSLVRHTVDGAFTSTSNMSSGISKGILHLTKDENYINDLEKKKIVEKPNDFVEGIGFGLTSMAGGIFHGVTDIITKPLEGAKKEGGKGFGKGLLKGFAGLIIKPVSGILELISKTSEGIKNTMHSSIEKSLYERKARTFYGKFKYVSNNILIWLY